MRLPILALLATAGFALAQTTVTDWQLEAVRKYPELARAGSEFNKKFTDAVTQAKETRLTLFSDPKWPMILADELSAPPPPPSPKTVVISDPLLLGKKRVVVGAADAAWKRLEQAVQSRNVAKISTACEQFTHEDAIFRAQAKTLGQALVEASRQIAEAQLFSQESVADVARLRRNAVSASIPNSLTPNDPARIKRAAELKDSADALEKQAEQNLAAAKKAFEDGLLGLQTLLQKAQEADAEKQPVANK